MVGRTISHYRILEQLGEGGMGVVYKAEDTSLRRMVALKFLSHFAVGAGHQKSRLIREAQSAAALDHPNINTVYEVDEVDGDTFIAMALVEGRTLREVMAEGSLTLADATDLAVQIGEGLAAAHARGIIHRDIKPGNVMVTTDGRAKILDFGLAKSPDCTQLTMTGSTCGTVAYMSPEQTRGEEVDHRTDIWSFGVMLHEMLTGRRPFEGGHDQAIVHAILNDEPSPVSELTADTPLELDRVVTGALVKDRDGRYQSMEDVVADLRTVCDVGRSVTVTLRAPRVGRAHWFTVLRTPRTWAAAAVMIAVVAAVSYLLSVVIGSGPPSAPSGAAAPLKRVMVAPFENLTGDAALDDVAKGTTQSICAELAREGFVQVVECSAEVTGGGGGTGTRTSRMLTASRDAGASILVAGSFLVQSDSLRVEARLLDSSDGAVLNAIPGEPSPFANPGEAAAKTLSHVMGALAARADPYVMRDALSHAPPYEAYQEYKAGRDAGASDAETALDHYARAMTLDPAFKTARFAEIFTLIQDVRARAQADSLAQEVLSRPGYLTPNMKLAIEGAAARKLRNYSEALRKFRELMRVEPQLPWIESYVADNALKVNRPGETIEIVRPILEQNRETGAHDRTWVHIQLCRAYHRAGEFEHQLEVAREGAKVFPGELFFPNQEVAALAALGRMEEIDRIVEESASTPVGRKSKDWGFHRSFDFEIRMTAVMELIAHGFVEEAAPRADDLVEWQRLRMAVEDDTYWPKFRLGWALYHADQWEEALAIFEQMAMPEGREAYWPQHQAAIAGLAAKLGDTERALEIKRELLAMDTYEHEPGMNKYFAGSIAAVLGEREEAVELLFQAIAEGNNVWGIVHKDIDYLLIRDYPPFQRLLEPRG